MSSLSCQALVRTSTSLAVVFIAVLSANAQSTSRSIPADSSQGSTSRKSVTSAGLNGYCPVCVIEMKKWVRGTSAYQAKYDGRTYYFPGEKQKSMFLANPKKYVPALGGDCAVCLIEKDKRMPGSIQFSALSGGRLFLFPSKMQKDMFVADPGKYTKADLAHGGNCVVCRVEMKQDVQGKTDVAEVLNGITYRFASEDQRKMFLANPAKYTRTAPSMGSTSQGSTGR